ncbi:unnamed protein product, partial [Iphiclides podalirius]
MTSQIIRPQVTTAIVDNTVSNSLANVLQLLVVSDVIASTLNPRAAAPCVLPPVSPICEPVPPLIYTPTVDVIAPRTEYIPPCAPAIDLIRPRCPCVEPLPSLYGVTEVLPPVFNGPTLTALGPNRCTLNEFIPGPANFAPAFPTPVCLQELAGPVQMSLGPNFCGGFTELIGPLSNFAPITELIFPPSIPGPMTCNVGCTPPSIAYANVEPIPYTGVNYFY